MEWRYLDSLPGRFGIAGCIRYLSSKNNAKEVLISQEDEIIADGTAKILRKRLRISGTHTKAGTDREE